MPQVRGAMGRVEAAFLESGFLTALDARVAAVFDDENEHWSGIPYSDELLADLRDVVNAGGKRLRALLCWWSFVGAGGAPTDPAVVELAAAVELFHAFALVHDDVMDDADTRRGRPSAHVVAAERHRASAWSGDPVAYGVAHAVLLGDLAFLYSDILGAEFPVAVRRIWHEMRREVTFGQYLDMRSAAAGDRREVVADLITCHKSARYSVQHPLQLGAALAGPVDLDERLAGLARAGLALGTAFQLRDDVIGVFGSPAVTGKPAGIDIASGKNTPLLAAARRRASADTLVALDRAGDPGLNELEIAALRRHIHETGGLAEIEARIDALCTDAQREFATLSMVPPAGPALDLLAHRAVHRRA